MKTTIGQGKLKDSLTCARSKGEKASGNNILFLASGGFFLALAICASPATARSNRGYLPANPVKFLSGRGATLGPRQAKAFVTSVMQHSRGIQLQPRNYAAGDLLGMIQRRLPMRMTVPDLKIAGKYYAKMVKRWKKEQGVSAFRFLSLDFNCASKSKPLFAIRKNTAKNAARAILKSRK